MRTLGNGWEVDSGDILAQGCCQSDQILSHVDPLLVLVSITRDIHHITTFLWRTGNSAYAPGHSAEAEVTQQVR